MSPRRMRISSPSQGVAPTAWGSRATGRSWPGGITTWPVQCPRAECGLHRRRGGRVTASGSRATGRSWPGGITTTASAMSPRRMRTSSPSQQVVLTASGSRATGRSWPGGKTTMASAMSPRRMRTSSPSRGAMYHSLGLKSDGTIVAWGDNSYGQCNVPAPNADFIAVAGGVDHSLGLKSDGTIVAWGYNAMASAMFPRRMRTSSPSQEAVSTAWGSRATGRSWPGGITTWPVQCSRAECGLHRRRRRRISQPGAQERRTIVAWG